MPNLLERLGRRRLGQWGLGYLAFTVAALGVQDAIADPLQLSDAVQRASLICLAFGLPLVLVLAWYHGEKGPQRVSLVELAWIGAIVLAAGASLRWAGSGPGAASNSVVEERATMSVAVLPFRDLGPSTAGQYFPDALTQELTVRLARVDGIRVRSARSVARFKDSELDVTDIAAELGVTHVIEGGLRRDGDRVRLTVQLTDASTGFGDWSDAFDAASSNVLSLAEEMSVRVAGALDLHLSPTELEAVRLQYTANSDAWDAFHQGWAFLEATHADGTYSEAELTRAEQYFARALELDPLYAPALAGMSLTHSFLAFAGIDRDPTRQELAEALALRALELDPDLPEARIALGQSRTTEGDHLAAVEAYEAALRLEDDNAMAWCLLAFVRNISDPQDAARAEEAARQSLARDPTWFLSYHQLGWALQGQGRYEEAEVALLDGIAINAAYKSAYDVLGQVQLSLGKYEDALATMQTSLSLGQAPVDLVYLGAAQVLTGDEVGGLESVERAIELGFGDLSAVEGSPYFASVREDPRFQSLLHDARSRSRGDLAR